MRIPHHVNRLVFDITDRHSYLVYRNVFQIVWLSGLSYRGRPEIWRDEFGGEGELHVSRAATACSADLSKDTSRMTGKKKKVWVVFLIDLWAGDQYAV